MQNGAWLLTSTILLGMVLALSLAIGPPRYRRIEAENEPREVVDGLMDLEVSEGHMSLGSSRSSYQVSSSSKLEKMLDY